MTENNIAPEPKLLSPLAELALTLLGLFALASFTGVLPLPAMLGYVLNAAILLAVAFALNDLGPRRPMRLACCACLAVAALLNVISAIAQIGN